MKLTQQQLSTHLNNNLLPVYLISSNELLLVQETRDAIRLKAKQQGFEEIQRFEINKETDLNRLLESTDTPSLFSPKICIEIKLTGKLNVGAAKVFTHFIENIHPNNIVIISSEKLDSASQKAAWFQAINKAGAIITLWPLDAKQFYIWVTQRLKKFNLTYDQTAINFLIEYTEGNLLACAQEIEKLSLLFANRKITLADMMNTIADNARFDIFNFMDIVLEGSATRIIRVLHKLKAEAVETTFLLWAITREIRNLINIIIDFQNKNTWDTIVKKFQIWDRRQPLFKRMIKLHTLKSLHFLLLECEKTDRMIKGQSPGNVWDQLETLTLNLSGATNEK